MNTTFIPPFPNPATLEQAVTNGVAWLDNTHPDPNWRNLVLKHGPLDDEEMRGIGTCILGRLTTPTFNAWQAVPEYLERYGFNGWSMNDSFAVAADVWNRALNLTPEVK